MISVVIPAFNEAELLPLCLTALAKQQGAPPFEVILVDNSSTDQTRAAAEKFQGSLNLKIITEARRGRGQARATGCAAATGEYILSTDADAVVPANWVADLAAALAKNAAVTGPAKINDCGRRDNSLFNSIFILSVYGYRLLFGSYWLGGYNFGIRRELYARSGGFDPQLNAMEDVDLGWRLKPWAAIKYLPKTVVNFSGRRFRRGVAVGLYAYLVQFIRYRRGPRSAVALPDVRE